MRLLAVLLAVLLPVALLAGCTPGSGPEDPVPGGVSISVYQPRPDVAKNRIAITVHNDGAQSITLTEATLASSYFTESAIWDGKATVPAGYAVDLRIDIPPTDCSGRVPEHRVSFLWQAGDESGRSSTEPEDPFGVLELLHDAGCLVEQVDAVAALTAASLTAPPSYPAPADLLITVQPTGAAGSIVLDRIHSTTLLNPAGPDGAGVAELALGVELDADGPLEVHVPIVPNRCDAHALAEDKVGTRMPLYVTTSAGGSGRYVLSASDELRAQMYAFYSAYCGL